MNPVLADQHPGAIEEAPNVAILPSMSSTPHPVGHGWNGGEPR
jgi:hypothetical protein